MSAATEFRTTLAGPSMIVAPGAYDSIGARLIQQTGFAAAYMTGGGTSAASGYPDYGLLTMSEMVENARRMVNSVSIPVIADADTGYGNELNVIRTVREFEAAGVAAIHIEDQEFPKRCGHVEGKVIIPLDDYLAKLRAAASARRNKDFTIIARTDSCAVYGFDEAIRRANASLAAGANIAFVEALSTKQQIIDTPRLVKGPCLLNIVWGGKTPLVSMQDAEAAGYKVTIVPGMLVMAATQVFEEKLTELKITGRHPPIEGSPSVQHFFNRWGAKDWDAARDAFKLQVAE